MPINDTHQLNKSFFESMSQRRRGFPSETHLKRGVRIVHREKWFEKKPGRNDLCPCGSHVNRAVAPSSTNQTWTADIATNDGWFSPGGRRRSVITQDGRCPADGRPRELPEAGLVAHSHRGVPDASEYCQALLKHNDITCSISRKGKCRDNAPMESRFATSKKELVDRERYPNRSQARQSLFEYLETFDNRVRSLSTLGSLYPVIFEQAI
jgi:putative transposase